MQHNKDGANLQQNKDDDYDGYLSNTINYAEYIFKTTKRMITSTIKKTKMITISAYQNAKNTESCSPHSNPLTDPRK